MKQQTCTVKYLVWSQGSSSQTYWSEDPLHSLKLLWPPVAFAHVGYVYRCFLYQQLKLSNVLNTITYRLAIHQLSEQWCHVSFSLWKVKRRVMSQNYYGDDCQGTSLGLVDPPESVFVYPRGSLGHTPRTGLRYLYIAAQRLVIRQRFYFPESKPLVAPFTF